MLRALPEARVARDPEVVRFIEAESLSGIGIGYVDAHLLAACRLTPGSRLWSRDKPLAEAAERLDLCVRPRL